MTTNLFLYDGEMPADIAEQLERKSKAEMIFDSDLAEGLNFTLDDLAANRDGVVSEWQLAFLSKKYHKALTTFYVATAIFIVLVVLITGVQLLRRPTPNQAELATAPVIIGVLYFLIVVFIWTSPRLVPDLDELQSNGIVSLFGQVSLYERMPRYELHMGTETFRLERDAYLRFKHLDHYTIYYAPRSKVILSAEPMTE